MTIISVIVGSTREGRFSEKPAQWILQHLRQREGIDARLLDLRDFPMPFFDEAAIPAARPRAVRERGGETLDGRNRRVGWVRVRHPGIQLRPLSGAEECDRLGLSGVEPQGGQFRELWQRWRCA